MAETVAGRVRVSRQRSRKVIQADLEDLEDRRKRYDRLDAEESTFDRSHREALQALRVVEDRVSPELTRLNDPALGPAGPTRQAEIAGLEMDLASARLAVSTISDDLIKVRRAKAEDKPYFQKYDQRKKRLLAELAKAESREEPPAVAPVSPEPPTPQPAEPVASLSDEDRLRDLHWDPATVDPAHRAEILKYRLTPEEWEHRQRRHEEQAAARPHVVVTTGRNWWHSRAPWIAVGVTALAVLVLWFFFLRPQTAVTTPTNAVPTAAPTAAPVALAYKISHFLVDVRGQEVDLDRFPTIIVDKASGKSSYPAKVIVTEADGDPASAVLVTVGDKSATTNTSGEAHLMLDFQTTRKVSEEQTLTVSVGEVSKTYKIWIGRFLESSVGDPALNQERMNQALMTDPRLRDALWSTAGVRPEWIVGIDIGTSDGRTPMISMDERGNITAGGTVPAGQPIWILKFRMPDGKVVNVAINPFCINVFIKPPAPVPSPTPVPSVPSPTPCVGILDVVKFEDVDGNREFRGADRRRGGFTFTVRGLSGERTLTGDSNGLAQFTGLAPGDYVVTEHARSGWRVTTGNPRLVNVTCGPAVSVLFGNQEIERSEVVPTPTPIPAPIPAPTPTQTPRPVSQFIPQPAAVRTEGGLTWIQFNFYRAGINVTNGVSPAEPFTCRFSLDDGGSGSNTISSSCSGGSHTTTPGTHTIWFWMKDANGATGLGSYTFTFQSNQSGSGQTPVSPSPTLTPAPTPQVSPSTNPSAGFSPPPGY